MRTFLDVFADFGGPARFAEATGVEPFHAQTMKTRGSIPPAYWPQTVAAAQKAEPTQWITLEALAAMAVARATERRASTPTEAA